MGDDVDREAILARRTLLVGAALAAVGCSRPDEEARSWSVEIPPLPRPTDLLSRRPPLTVDERVPDPDRGPLAELRQSLLFMYEDIMTAWSSFHAVEGVTAEMARSVLRSHRALRPVCGQPRGERTSVHLRKQAHWLFAADHVLFLRQAMPYVMKEHWPLEPQVCLSCAREEPDLPVVRYASEAVEPDAEGGAALAELAAALGDFELTVSGHADSVEPDADVLSRSRAERVRDRLVWSGVPADRIHVRALGDALPLANAPSAENRRVDFDFGA